MENPWTCLPERPPYVLEIDEPRVMAFNKRLSSGDHIIQLSSLPEPYLGDPDAPVVILNLNPGHSDEDAKLHAQPCFEQANRENLLHRRERYPLYLLDSDLPCPGQQWWKRHLRRLIDAVGLKNVARNVFIAEYFPYHTTRYVHRRLCVPSQLYTFFLVRKAIERDALVIFFRSVEQWHLAIPELKDHPRSAVVTNWQNPHVSRGQLPNHFDDIVAAAGGSA